MSEPIKKKTLSINITVFGVFLFIACLISGLTLGLQHYFSRDLAQTAAESTFRTTSEMINERVQALDSRSVSLVRIVSHLSELELFPEPGQERQVLPLICGALENAPSIYSVYMGYDTGDFFEIVNLESSEKVRGVFGAAEHDRWLIVKVTDVSGVRKKITVFLDSSFRPRTEKQEVADYDPRERPWYKDAITAKGIIKTEPYVFSNLGSPGVTYATNGAGKNRVAAVDISLAGLSGFLQRQQLLPHSKVFMFDRNGDVIARASDGEKELSRTSTSSILLNDEEKQFLLTNPVIRASNEMDWPPFDFAMSGKPKGYSIELLNLLAEKSGFNIEYVNGYSWEELLTLFNDGKLDLLHSLIKTPERERMGIFSEQYIPMPQSFVIKKGGELPSSLADLKEKTIAIPKGWATDTYLEKNHPRIKRMHVATTLDSLRAVSSGEAYATLDSEPVVRYLINSYFLRDLEIGGQPQELTGSVRQGLHFLVRPDNEILASILNKALAAVTDEELSRLDAKWFDNNRMNSRDSNVYKTVLHAGLLELARSVGTSGDLELLKMRDKDYFSYVVQIKSVYGSNEFLGLIVPVREMMRPYMEKIRFSLLLTLLLLICLIPVVWYSAKIIVNPINALSLESEKVRQRRYQEVGMVDSNITEILGLSRSMVSMASAIQDYEESLRDLMDSLIKLIASAIDHKSPYTGGHCARVPELSIMLARAASDSSEGPLSEFSLSTEDEWNEFRTAAWLHDCGKVATPEHIVDKATKLETIYNRIHEVRMRFEVLLRDAEVNYWRNLAKGGDETILTKQLAEQRREIQDDFAFIAECNLGGEFMAEENIDRVRKIAEQTWVRHLSDRLGLGHIELQRYSSIEPQLPCEEPILADRAEHIIMHPTMTAIGLSDSCFSMDVPENLYNLGEIYNLCIARGTLTAEDRYKINEHIVTTIRMLETLPFPENMKKVPEYAGTHHETLIGTGYPRRLTANEISLPGRIMAIADVFEALTASDRPYKKAKKLSEAIRILSFMVKDQHLDKDLFRLFLESGIFLEYASKYLAVSQIDDVNIADFL